MAVDLVSLEATIAKALPSRFALYRFYHQDHNGARYLATSAQLGQWAMVKAFFPSVLESGAKVRQMLDEVDLTAHFGNHGFVNLQDVVYIGGGNPLLMAITPWSGLSLQAALATSCFTPRHAVNGLYQLLSSLLVLHKCGIVHGRVQPSNIAVVGDLSSAESFTLKLSDFSGSQVFPGGAQVPPRAAAVDLVAIGCILGRMMRSGEGVSLPTKPEAVSQALYERLVTLLGCATAEEITSAVENPISGVSPEDNTAVVNLLSALRVSPQQPGEEAAASLLAELFGLGLLSDSAPGTSEAHAVHLKGGHELTAAQAMQHPFFAEAFRPEHLEVVANPVTGMKVLEGDPTRISENNSKAIVNFVNRAVAKWSGQRSFQNEVCAAQAEVDSLCPGRYLLLKHIGQGTYGVVFQGLDLQTKTDVAVKHLKFDWVEAALSSTHTRSARAAHRIFREVVLLWHFNLHPSPNVLELRDALCPSSADEFLAKPGPLYLVTDFIDRDLSKLLRQSSSTLTEKQYQSLIAQILQGLHYLKKAGVLHRDLKPGNILVGGDCELRICDYGLARGADGDQLTNHVGTRHYRAPELVMSEDHYDYKVDIWSVGCIMAKMFRGGRGLFTGVSRLSQIESIVGIVGVPSAEELQWISDKRVREFLLTDHGSQRGVSLRTLVQAPDGGPLSEQALDLLTRMLQFVPHRRISVEEAVQHPYLSEFYNEELFESAPPRLDFGMYYGAVNPETQDAREVLGALFALIREIREHSDKKGSD